MIHILGRPSSARRMIWAAMACRRAVRLEELAAQGVIDRAAVIGIDQAEIPELASLVEIGNTGRDGLSRSLGERVDPAGLGDAGNELLKLLR